MNQKRDTYISLEKSLSMTHSKYMHAAHCLLYFKSEDSQNTLAYFGLGQLRFDGMIGFPGGMISDKICVSTLDDILKGLKEELREEIAYISKDDDNSFVHVSSLHRIIVQNKQELILHFFIKAITLEEFEECEKHHMKGIHFPLESLGVFRIPLIDPKKCQNSSLFKHYFNFMDNFLKHHFAGNAKEQLLQSIQLLNCYSLEYFNALEILHH